MNELACRDLEELLPAYAADALDEEERVAVATHLAECRRHDADLAALRSDLERLALLAEPVQPPAGLSTKLFAAFDRAVAGADPDAHREPLPRRRWRPTTVTGFGYALAAALLVVAVGLGVWGASRDGGGEPILVRTTTEDGSTLRLTYIKSHQLAVLDFDLQSPPPDHVYQAWQIVEAAPVSLAILDNEVGRLTLDVDLKNASAIALSVEPKGGSAAPTSEPILVTRLKGSDGGQ